MRTPLNLVQTTEIFSLSQLKSDKTFESLITMIRNLAKMEAKVHSLSGLFLKAFSPKLIVQRERKKGEFQNRWMGFIKSFQMSSQVSVGTNNKYKSQTSEK